MRRTRTLRVIVNIDKFYCQLNAVLLHRTFNHTRIFQNHIDTAIKVGSTFNNGNFSICEIFTAFLNFFPTNFSNEAVMAKDIVDSLTGAKHESVSTHAIKTCK